jgi:hypothetical protein
LRCAIYLQSLTLPSRKAVSLSALTTAAAVVVVVLAELVPCALVLVMPEPVVMLEPMAYALVVVMPEPVVMLEPVVVIAELVAYALEVVMPKLMVMLELVVLIAEPVVYGLVVVMLELLVYALVLPPLVVPPMMRDAQLRLVPACYDPEIPKASTVGTNGYTIYRVWLCCGRSNTALSTCRIHLGQYRRGYHHHLLLPHLLRRVNP